MKITKKELRKMDKLDNTMESLDRCGDE